MTITLKKRHLALAILAVVLAIPTTAYATHVFDDVPDGKFYADPVEWAFDNGITTGKTPDSFDPEGAVTRGEAVTFLKRYHDYSVTNYAGMFDSESSFTPTAASGDLGLTASVTVPADHTGVIEIGFTAESECTGVGGNDWCVITLLVDGVAVDVFPSDFAFDSTNDGAEAPGSWEGHAMTRVTEELAAGTYAVTAESSLEGATSFRLDDMVLTAEVHITG